MVPHGQFHLPPLFAWAKAYPRAVRNGPLRRESAAEAAIRIPGPRNAFLKSLCVCTKNSRDESRRRRGYDLDIPRRVRAIADSNEQTTAPPARTRLSRRRRFYRVRTDGYESARRADDDVVPPPGRVANHAAWEEPGARATRASASAHRLPLDACKT